MAQSCFPLLSPNLSLQLHMHRKYFFSHCRDAKKDFIVPAQENAPLATVMAMQTDALMDLESVW